MGVPWSALEVSQPPLSPGRLSERLARLQQEQLQQVPRGLCVQGLGECGAGGGVTVLRMRVAS